jgi:hypothetical protein
MPNSLRAAVLAGNLFLDPQPLDPFKLRTPPVRLIVRNDRLPLDNEAAYFRYRIDCNGEVLVRPAIPGARISREKSARRRTRSVARS